MTVNVGLYALQLVQNTDEIFRLQESVEEQNVWDMYSSYSTPYPFLKYSKIQTLQPWQRPYILNMPPKTSCSNVVSKFKIIHRGFSILVTPQRVKYKKTVNDYLGRKMT